MKKVKVAIFLVFTNRFQLLKQKKFWTKNAENFHNASIFFQIFTISKMKTRTQIFPKMNKNDFMKLKVQLHAQPETYLNRFS
jgi:amino acid permease